MQQTSEKKAKTPICKPSEALISLLTNYSKEDVDHSFKDVNTIFMEWLGTNHADNTEKRESIAYSIEILQELGTIIQGISPKKIKNLKTQMQSFKKELA